MTQQALGMIETFGLVAAIAAADAALKTAAVRLVGYEQVKSGRIMVAVSGEVAAVQASVAAGSAAASEINTVFSRHVIPRPIEDIQILVGPGAAPDTPAPNPNPEEQTGELEKLSVRELRSLARQTKGIALQGRQISRANKAQLIVAILKARGNN